MATETISLPTTPEVPQNGKLTRVDSTVALPTSQCQLQLHAARQAYSIEHDCQIPNLNGEEEVLLQVYAIGLNPIDWKSPDYGFGIPSLPFVSGREFVGRVIAVHKDTSSDVRIGDCVLSVSTDYRDYRKSAFQEYAIASSFNVIKLPEPIDPPYAAAIGVAVVSAAVALGVSLGVSFPRIDNVLPLDLLSIAQSQLRAELPVDVVGEVFDAITPANRPQEGEWILINGASSITGQMSIQLAKLVGLKVVAVADMAKHEEKLKSLAPDVLIDRKNLDEAADQIRSSTPGSLRFAIDTVGSKTAAWCQEVLSSRILTRHSSSPSPGPSDRSSTSTEPRPPAVGEKPNGSSLGHLVGLTGLPKIKSPTVRGHKLPIKLFHENRALGAALCGWLEDLLRARLIQLPETELVGGGLGVVNESLDRLRRGEVGGKRLVVLMNK